MSWADITYEEEEEAEKEKCKIIEELKKEEQRLIQIKIQTKTEERRKHLAKGKYEEEDGEIL
jgi:hypothetical protein